ncbi:hypothetical protein QIH87_14345 [Bradyrhizobium elkanii]|uniref:hypothetical protein n=1 Tax=Bradyrhizobium elkanii TaxID=29448 RepID=UPI0010218496|nr:hypothetical protein [Bradyrhizobium elkanii]MCW2112458.1 hypothetical protein [Bradyrhizobium elkanii]MCW2199185.1 hypothetical protein [Bradyrhizobium elkanii]MCW2229262.1 hypothetical protein [Bradyrhizobium elkanii]NWL38126.1 hypothetical protein [Bradyrhizobium elkanii]RYM17276.1 hypothetical protein EWH13_38030 [Bradyrhizobium elkanii]
MAEGDGVRIIKHSTERIPDSGSFEVKLSDKSYYFYWDDNAERRSVRGVNDSHQALEKAKAFAKRHRGDAE